MPVENVDKYLPKYTPTPMSATKQGRHIVHREGKKEYQVPRLPYVRAIDPSGHLLALVISTNRDPAERDRNYETLAIQRLTRHGGFLWDTPPYGCPMDKWVTEREIKAAALRKVYADREVEEGHKPSEALLEQAKTEILDAIKAKRAK
jgi:hypothetical protein